MKIRGKEGKGGSILVQPTIWLRCNVRFMNVLENVLWTCSKRFGYKYVENG